MKINQHCLLLIFFVICSCTQQLLVRSFSPNLPLLIHHHTAYRTLASLAQVLKAKLDDATGVSPVFITPESKEESWNGLFTLALQSVILPDTALEITKLCDRIDQAKVANRSGEEKVLRSARMWALTRMLQRDRQEYIHTVNFLLRRIPREDLPNLQDIEAPVAISSSTPIQENTEIGLIADCTLPNTTFTESLLDRVLLSIFRGLVQKEISFKSEKQGITGLLAEGRHYMLSSEGTELNQHTFVKNVLAGLMTPFLPPFYRLFMSGIVPSAERGDPEWLVSLTNSIIDALPENMKSAVRPGRQFGPWVYAPALTSIVTPPFLNFLVGPSRPNRRKDGALGGMVVEKCKFLQESGCKGLCLHQCKLPAQQFFDEKLGLSLTVSPNFATQECQWSWGEVPINHTKDPSFPKGCLVGCPTRSFAVADNEKVSCY